MIRNDDYQRHSRAYFREKRLQDTIKGHWGNEEAAEEKRVDQQNIGDTAMLPVVILILLAAGWVAFEILRGLSL
ncbi:hypothetical protein [Limosilactobacillus mucosae]|uniref:hypothetical protein n=1 Tax=Limosilactobacillus mucosae TaxID=97478 RepID=UPI0022E942FC|nr:hypothetical protein [Limosilactobacillus mucosae]